MRYKPRYNNDLFLRDAGEKGWSAGTLAGRAFLSESTVSRFLSGDRQTPKTAQAMARALRKPLARYVVAA